MKNKILVVDDDKNSAKTLAWAMDLFGKNVIVAHDGKSALEMAHDYVPDAILLDLGMPEMDGYEVCTKLREDPRLQNTLFIAQTGWASESHRRMSKLVGFHYHMVKPIDLKKLKELLEV